MFKLLFTLEYFYPSIQACIKIDNYARINIYKKVKNMLKYIYKYSMKCVI